MTKADPAKLDYVNAVRGLAILLVIVLHVSYTIKGLPEPFLYMLVKGAYGVQLFFVASAFTLFLSYSRRIGKEGEHTKYNFFVRRFFRISPMYYLATIFYIIVFTIEPSYNDGKPLAAWKIITNVFYLNGFIPGAINYVPPGGWSVAVEMIFYCCLPFLFGRIKSLKSSLIWFAVLAIGSVILKLVIRFVLIRLSIPYEQPEGWFLYFWFPNQLPAFMLGIVLFFMIKSLKINSQRTVYVAITVSTLLLFLFMYVRRDIDPQNILPEHVIVSMFYTVNIYLLSQAKISVFDNKITRFLGEISFSLYLVHFVFISLLTEYVNFNVDPYTQLLLRIVFTVVISSLVSKITYHVVELKGMEWSKKFLKHNSKPVISKAEGGL